MNVRDRLIDSLQDLDAESVLWLYDLAIGLRRKDSKPASLGARQRGMDRCAKALANLPGSLADEVMRDREDRL